MLKVLTIITLLMLHVAAWAETNQQRDDWHAATLSAVQDYLSKTDHQTLLQSCARFLDMPNMITINTSPSKLQLEYTLQHEKNKEAIRSHGANALVLGHLICGLGGGPTITVIFEKTSKTIITTVSSLGR